MAKKDNKTHTFRIEYKTTEGEELEGTFTVKRLSIMGRSKVGVRKSQLSGGMYCVVDDDGKPTGQGLDEDTDFVNTAMAHLELSLIQQPDWFDLDEIHEMALLRKVYEEVMDFEWSFFRPKGQKATEGDPVGDLADASGADDEGKLAGNDPTKVVGSEVQASLDA